MLHWTYNIENVDNYWVKWHEALIVLFNEAGANIGSDGTGTWGSLSIKITPATEDPDEGRIIPPILYFGTSSDLTPWNGYPCVQYMCNATLSGHTAMYSANIYGKKGSTVYIDNGTATSEISGLSISKINGEGWIASCCKNIAGQTYYTYKSFVTDDGLLSTKNMTSILEIISSDYDPSISGETVIIPFICSQSDGAYIDQCFITDTTTLGSYGNCMKIAGKIFVHAFANAQTNTMVLDTFGGIGNG